MKLQKDRYALLFCVDKGTGCWHIFCHTYYKDTKNLIHLLFFYAFALMHVLDCHLELHHCGPHKTRPQHVEWNHMEPLTLTACGLTWCRPQTLGPATMAPYPSPTQYNYQLLTAIGITRPTTCETINPHTTRGLTLSGEPSTTSGATSSHWTNGNLPLKQPPFVLYICLRFEHLL